MKYFVLILFFMYSITVAHAKKYTFYCDAHIGSKHPVSPEDQPPTSKEKMIEENAYDGGDSYDIKRATDNCEDIKKRWLVHKQLFKDRLVIGNHSFTKDDTSATTPFDLLIDEKILLTHGDIALKGKEIKKIKECSYDLIEPLRDMHTHLSKSDITKLAQYTFDKSKGLTHISVSCHTHIDESEYQRKTGKPYADVCVQLPVPENNNGKAKEIDLNQCTTPTERIIRVINLPRGKTELDL